MEEQDFWNVIERTWQQSGRNENRKTAVVSNDEGALEQLANFIDSDLLETYKSELNTMRKEELTAYIHQLEEKLYRIDRAEIQQHTDGSDDGFLYCRCFIVSMGKDYYEAIDRDPAKATFDLEAELFGFTPYSVYEERFGEEFDRNSIHCIESCSNPEGWKNVE